MTRFLTALIAVLMLLPATGAAGKDRKRKQEKPVSAPILQTERPVWEFTPSISLQPIKVINLYDTISITFIGDVMQHGKQINDALIPGKDPHDASSYQYEYAFKHIEERLQEADLAVANMEFPMGLVPYSGYPLFSAPESILHQAQKSGIDLFLLANNHLFDKGKRGFEKTLDVYEQANAAYTGAYRNREQELEENPVFYNIKGIRVALINFTYGTNGMPVPAPCTINLMDSTHVKECIYKAKKKGADIIICLPHWGEEYQLKPNIHQRRWARMLFREGADIIIGSHPHVPQSGEYSSSKAVFYSLGNYISNQSIPDYTQLELMITMRIQKNSHTGETTLLTPIIEYLWCFKKGEFAPHYTVVPVEKIIGKNIEGINAFQMERMERTYRSFLEKGLIKENESLK